MGRKSTPIFKLGLAGIALSVLIMHCTGFIISGFKHDIQNKIALYSGFGTIESAVSRELFLQEADSLKNNLEKSNIPSNPYLTASITIQTKAGINSVQVNGFEHLPKNWRQNDSSLVYVSQTLFDKLKLNRDSTANAVLAISEERYSIRKLKFYPAFESYLEDIDQKSVYVDLHHLQELLQLGYNVRFIASEDTLQLFPKNARSLNIEDQSFDAHNVSFVPNKWPVQINITDQNGQMANHTITQDSQGELNNHHDYISGLQLNQAHRLQDIERNIPYTALYTSSKERFPQLFSWLTLLYTNVTVILILVLGIALINNASVLLVLIIEKTTLIALLKAMGTENKRIKKTFAYTSLRLNIKALIWGNTLALLLACAQWQFDFIKLNPKDYFVERVPFAFDITYFVGINMAVLLLPFLTSYLPLRILKRMNTAELLRLN